MDDSRVVFGDEPCGKVNVGIRIDEGGFGDSCAAHWDEAHRLGATGDDRGAEPITRPAANAIARSPEERNG
jgi:hypothetical protein